MNNLAIDEGCFESFDSPKEPLNKRDVENNVYIKSILQDHLTIIDDSAYVKQKTIESSGNGINIDSKCYEFSALMNVYGNIVSVENSTISARIYEHSGEYVEDIELEKSEFSESEQKLIHDGAVFYWKVGQKKYTNGSIKNASEFKMRRIFSPNIALYSKEVDKKVHSYKKVFDA